MQRFIAIVVFFVFSSVLGDTVFPSTMVISKNAYTWRKSLTVYDSNCQELAKLKKRCSSWNNDVEFYTYDSNGDEQLVAYTDYRTRIESTLDVYLASNRDQSVLRVTFGFWNKISVTFGGDSSMLILDPTITSPIGGRITDKGMLLGTIDANTFLSTEITLLDIDGNILYDIENPFNLEINPCRSENLLASAFYTVTTGNNATAVIPHERFIPMVSTLILNFASDSSDDDGCTNWTLIWRWVVLAAGIVIIIVGAVVGFKYLWNFKLKDYFK